MKPEDICRIPLVSDPRASPDGRLVAFVVTEADQEANEYRSQIWIVPSDGSEPPRRLTSGKRDSMPRWSPDGSRLAFVSARKDDKAQLYVLPMVGGEAVRLTECDEGASGPVWSPDGERIAFSSTVRDPSAAEEDEAKRPPLRITRLKFKADGAGWRTDLRNHVFVVAADGSAPPEQLTDGDFDHADPAWSPDGRRLAVVAYREDDWDTSLAADVHLIEVDPTKLVRLTHGEGQFAKPSWSPDGTSIAARANLDLESAPRNSQVVVINATSGEIRSLTAALDRQCGPFLQPREPIWRADRVLFPMEAGGNGHLYSVPAAGGEPEPLITGDLVVTDHDAAGETIVHAVSTPTQPPELFCGKGQLTTVTADFTCSVRLAMPQRFTAASADGSEVEAWALAPAETRPGARQPALVFIHGGPFAQYGNAFFDEFQIAAGAGYAVIYCNPRGSSGYPEEWGRAIRGPISGGPGWGTVDYEDVMAVVDEAIRRFDFIDPDRLGVLGGSYGGFLTAWIIAHTDRFKAACAERGIYNVVSAIGTSDGLWSSYVFWGGNPYEHMDKMMEISPITYADRMTTPLLLIHSDQDHRCPVEQAEQLFTRLRLLGREVELLRFPQGTHDLSRSGPPRQRIYRFQAIIDWFGSHLGE